MTLYDLVKIIHEIITYQQNEIGTYKIIVLIETLVIIFLSCELAGRQLLG